MIKLIIKDEIIYVCSLTKIILEENSYHTKCRILSEILYQNHEVSSKYLISYEKNSCSYRL